MTLNTVMGAAFISTETQPPQTYYEVLQSNSVDSVFGKILEEERKEQLAHIVSYGRVLDLNKGELEVQIQKAKEGKILERERLLEEELARQEAKRLAEEAERKRIEEERRREEESQKINVEVTFYTPLWYENGYSQGETVKTATGYVINPNNILYQGRHIIAANSKYPLGSLGELEFGGNTYQVIVIDRGGAMQRNANLLDFLVSSSGEAEQLGRKQGKLRVTRWGW